MALYFSRKFKKAWPTAATPQHVVPFEVDVALPTDTGTTGPTDTQNNIINIGKFPRNSKLVLEQDWLCYVAGELDANATETLDINVQVSANEDGSSGTTLISLVGGGTKDGGISTTGTATGTSRVRPAAGEVTGTDLSDKFLQLKIVNVPATKSGTAASVKVSGYYTRGANELQLDLTSQGDYDSGTTI